MDQTREQLEQQVKPSTGVAGDAQRLKTDATASVEELREFVAGLKGRSPQEVLGIVTGNSLFQGVLQATIGCALLLAVTSVGPWMLDDKEAEAAETAAAEAAAQPAATDAAEPAADATVAAAAAATGAVDPASAATAMGIDEVKNADTASNPLDANLDNLLDALDD